MDKKFFIVLTILLVLSVVLLTCSVILFVLEYNTLAIIGFILTAVSSLTAMSIFISKYLRIIKKK